MNAVNIKFGMLTVEEYEFEGRNTRTENYRSENCTHDPADEDECDMEQ
ncbi:hypothetical protein JYT33_01530 [Alkaliphilus transvaalensis]|nr:hypothetical protein [Alkaliphilus transvaalensis]